MHVRHLAILLNNKLYDDTPTDPISMSTFGITNILRYKSHHCPHSSLIRRHYIHCVKHLVIAIGKRGGSLIWGGGINGIGLGWKRYGDSRSSFFRILLLNSRKICNFAAGFYYG